ncbi:MAG: hypothetical protein IJY42_02545 [Clostridia bacterium]|nr:hypothetical protein [Clostridia bacterium]
MKNENVTKGKRPIGAAILAVLLCLSAGIFLIVGLTQFALGFELGGGNAPDFLNLLNVLASVALPAFLRCLVLLLLAICLFANKRTGVQVGVGIWFFSATVTWILSVVFQILYYVQLMTQYKVHFSPAFWLFRILNWLPSGLMLALLLLFVYAILQSPKHSEKVASKTGGLWVLPGILAVLGCIVSFGLRGYNAYSQMGSLRVLFEMEASFFTLLYRCLSVASDLFSMLVAPITPVFIFLLARYLRRPKEVPVPDRVSSESPA